MENNEKNKMSLKDLLNSAPFMFLGLLVAFPLYMQVKEIVPLRVFLIILLIAWLALFFLYLRTELFNKKPSNIRFVNKAIAEYSKHHTELWIAWFLAFAIFVVFGIVVSAIPKDEVIIKNNAVLEGDAEIIEEPIAYSGCRLINGIECITMYEEWETLKLAFSIKFHNKSDDMITFSKDAIGIELLEFIPLEQLIIKEQWGGADVWSEPIEYYIDLKSEERIQYAYPITEGEEKNENKVFKKLPGHDEQRFNLKVYTEEKGYYRFKLIINYDQGGEPKSYDSKEYHFVYMDSGTYTNNSTEQTYSNEQSSSYEQTQVEKNNSSGSVEQDPDTMQISTEVDWRNDYLSFVMNDEFINTRQEFYPGMDENTLRYSMYDMDNNGVPELLIYNGEVLADSCYYVYTCVLDKDKKENVSNIGTLGFREGTMVYAPESTFNGIYYQSGNMGAYIGVYYSLEDGQIIDETVMESTESESADSSDAMNIEQITDNDDLFNTFTGWNVYNSPEEVGLKTIFEFEKKDIWAMGWDNYLQQYGY